jgi:triacylglycerol esterase/lipase EstA (alpha/beta hydrolase family)
MKTKRIMKFIGLSIVALILISVFGLIAWSETGTYEAGESAMAALQSTDSVKVTQEQWIIFEPVNETETGIIFYPGGLVEATAYAPILHKISDEGILVVITPMPLNLAIMNTNAANDVIDSFPKIKKWIIAGHSLGGAAAAIYAENHPERIDAIILWDSYPANSADLSNNAISALSIFGTTNGVPNPENFNETRHLLPINTSFIGIEGANHAQFGDYGPQKGDVIASISMSEQQKRTADIVLEFIKEIQ